MFSGVIVPMITPFKEDYSIDFEGLETLVKYLVEEGVDGLFPVSTTGEFPHLSFNEALKIVEKTIEYAGDKTRILPGATANTPLQALEYIKAYEDLGVDGVVVAPPYFFKYGYEELKEYYSIIAEKTNLPIIVYNIPSLTGNNIPVELLVELAGEYSNIVGVKITYDSISYMRRTVYKTKEARRDFTVLTGLDDYLLPLLMLGGDGGIMACANIAPRIHLELIRAWYDKNYEKAIEQHLRLNKLVEIYDIASSYASAIKTALNLLGLPIKPVTRPPLRPEDPEVVQEIKNILIETGLLV